MVIMQPPWFLTLMLTAHCRAQPELPSQVPWMVHVVFWGGGPDSMAPKQYSVEHPLYASLVQTPGE